MTLLVYKDGVLAADNGCALPHATAAASNTTRLKLWKPVTISMS